MKQLFVDAYNRRMAVWNTIRENPGCSLQHVYDANPDMSIENIRVILRKLLERGSIVREGTYRRPIFHPTSLPPETAEESQERTRTNLESARCKRREADRTRRIKPERYPQPEPWRTLNVDPERPPIKNQGGQGGVICGFGYSSIATLETLA